MPPDASWQQSLGDLSWMQPRPRTTTLPTSPATLQMQGGQQQPAATTADDGPLPFDLPPLPGYQNPGAGLLANFRPIQPPQSGVSPDFRGPPSPPPAIPDSSLPSPAFASPSGAAPAAMPSALLSALTRGGGSAISGGLGQGSPLPTGQAPLPLIFNGGGSQQDAAIPATRGGASPANFRLAIPQDGGQSFYQSILPGERGPGGVDTMRRGTTAAEIQQQFPGMEPLQMLQMLEQNRVLANATANRNLGNMTNADFHAQDRNAIERQRLAQTDPNSPDVRRRAAEAEALRQFSAPGNDKPWDHYIQQLQTMEASGFFGPGAPPTAGGRPVGASSGALPGIAPAATPAAAVVGTETPTAGSNYHLSPTAIVEQPSIADPLHQRIQASARLRMPTPAAGTATPLVDTTMTPGELVVRLNTESPGLFANNPQGLRMRAALRPYLEQRFGPDVVAEAYRGVNQLGPLTTTPRNASLATWGATGGGTAAGLAARGGLGAGTAAIGGIVPTAATGAARWTPWGALAASMTSIPTIADYARSAWRGGRMTPDQEGRSMLANALAGQWGE